MYFVHLIFSFFLRDLLFSFMFWFGFFVFLIFLSVCVCDLSFSLQCFPVTFFFNQVWICEKGLRGVFRTHSNIYDGDFLRKCIVDVRLSSIRIWVFIRISLLVLKEWPNSLRNICENKHLCYLNKCKSPLTHCATTLNHPPPFNQYLSEIPSFYSLSIIPFLVIIRI